MSTFFEDVAPADGRFCMNAGIREQNMAIFLAVSHQLEAFKAYFV